MEDAERAAAFYRAAFGCEIAKWDGPIDYCMVKTSAPGEMGIDGGLTHRSDLVKTTVVTLDVPDLDAAMANVADNGGAVLTQKVPVGDMGIMAYFQDTEGNVVGLWQTLTPKP